ncbi:uncharacterized protein [Parasteatoda tepidariorum]|uniref:Uncharacterized protein n=1 Tax=Parasteatoda tepidariorum TaxID=114398 RepID=A0A2L2XXD0_PARTP|nr:uncharacterized protein LOC107454165 [Parasteatoda tepidariorum]XP_015926729.1 uncharacterized protein LOC107454165 [Parasteatoda tepidariorum]XP_015926730.1 uncharacterized protein LOC107454165 [Parasteatoda tepidariorum]XP_015926731.1 uncharacterized protein LOC107454165 [Parasteatoda tepidariorum]XP_015926733.1 uncharacterized protein LOC107454165 [Parasteatoda tepidariorum]
MGMSTDMAPRFLSVNPSGQMTYVLDANNIGLTQVQLAVPASEIVLIQDDNKSINLCDNSVLVADVPSDSVNWLGNNVIVLVSQPQEYVVVEQEVVVDSNVAQSWQVNGASICTTSTSQYAIKESQEEEAGECLEEEVSTSTVEDAKCWFRDSLITTAALSTLTTYVQSNAGSKVG